METIDDDYIKTDNDKLIEYANKCKQRSMIQLVVSIILMIIGLKATIGMPIVEKIFTLYMYAGIPWGFISIFKIKRKYFNNLSTGISFLFALTLAAIVGFVSFPFGIYKMVTNKY